MLEQYDLVLVPEEADEILRIGMNRVYKMLNNGELKAHHVGRTWRVSRESIINYFMENAQ